MRLQQAACSLGADLYKDMAGTLSSKDYHHSFHVISLWAELMNEFWVPSDRMHTNYVG